ncbi:MAG: UDP-N-acetylmuramoyl-L-alanine--D-glutamate ligase [Candidatus Omnitrophota bacterium]
MELSGKKVLVVGLGKSGEATALFLGKKGALVRLTEAGDNPALREKKKSLESTGIEVELGQHSETFLGDIELVVPSPGVTPESFPVRFALKNRIPVWSEIELAYRFCPAPILAITGTNGKSTAVTLLYDILKTAGKKVILAGNIGTPFISVVEDLAQTEAVVLEVSSFQLEWIVEFRAKVAVLLNVTADHLDRYPDFDSYLSAKKRIFENQTPEDFAVINYDDPVSRSLATGIKARTFFYTRTNPIPVKPNKSYKCRGRIYPTRGLDESSPYSLGLTGGINSCGFKQFFCTDDKTIFLPSGEELLTIPKSRLWGIHNQENILSVCAAAHCFGARPPAMVEAIKKFQPLNHRMELVAEKSGIRYVDDSKATNVDSTLRALQSFPESKTKRLILILGGKDKGGSYLPLKPALKKRVKALILLGEATDRIKKELAGSSDIKEVSSLPEGVLLAHSLAVSGDTVLLSPACSSFDMFESYAERGNIFKKAVASLP